MAAEPSFYMLTYKYVDNILEARAPHRPGHLELINAGVEEGVVLMAGPTDPPTGAFFLFRCADPSTVAAFVEKDPYVANGLVPSHTIQKWNVVCGGYP